MARRRLEDVRPLLLGARASGSDAVPRAHRGSRGTTRRRVLPATGTLAEGVVCHRCRVAGTWPASRPTATCRLGCRSGLPGSSPKTTQLRLHQSWPRPMLSRRRAACAPCRDFASYARAELACSTGHLATAIELTRDLLQGPWSAWWSDAIRCLSFAALLAEDEDALRSRRTPPSEPCVPHPAYRRGPSTVRTGSACCTVARAS